MNFDASISRRRLLGDSLRGLGCLAFTGLQARAAGLQPSLYPARARRVIMMFMQGGVSQVDTFDPKPKLTADHGKLYSTKGKATLFGSPWQFAQHGQSGQWISELLPHTARHADDVCVLTAMQTDQQAHETAVPMFHTGNPTQSRPSIGAWSLYGLGSETQDLPGYIAFNSLRSLGAQSHGSAFLPAEYQATIVREGGAKSQGAPPVPNLLPGHLSPEQQRAQLDLLSRINRRRLEHDRVNPELEGVIHSYEMAFRMQTAMPSLMDLNNESPDTLKSYGIGESATDSFGRQCLFARKFAEAGVRFIEIGTGGWDHHFDLKINLPESCAKVDKPIGALLTDLSQRGMLEDTLVVFACEFGRTPFAEGADGRDHNNRAFTVWMAGGGVKPGFRYGVTDDYGVEGVEERVHIHDLHATILHLLGLDHNRLTYRYSGRDWTLTDLKGRVVEEIVA